MSIIEKLEKSYNNYFNNCIVSNTCRQVDLKKQFSDDKCFCYSHSAQLSKGYENAKNKLLLVGLEGLRSEDGESNDHVTIKDAYNWATFVDNKSTHWKGTMFSVLKFCKRYNNDKMIEIDNECNDNFYNYFKQDCEFAFTNLLKCAFYENNDAVKFRNSFYKNCLNLLINEINILDPDLIIIQGKTLRENNLKFDSFMGAPQLIDPGIIPCHNKEFKMPLYKYCKAEKKDRYVIYAYHPCCKSFNWSMHNEKLYQLIDKYYECIS